MFEMVDENKGHSFTEFQVGLADAQKWCSQKWGAVGETPQLLRTYALQPIPLAGDRKKVVASVILRRQIALTLSRDELFLPQIEGRLLLYRPDDNLADGAAEVATYGFFDSNNVPPWDTWVAYVYEATGDNYLVSWIPSQFVALAEAGIQANPERCVCWLD